MIRPNLSQTDLLLIGLVLLASVTGTLLIFVPPALKIAVALLGAIGGTAICYRLRAAQQELSLSLRSSETRYRMLAEDQPDLICRFRVDGTLSYANQAFCRYIGLPHEELIGRPLTAFLLEQGYKLVHDQLATQSHPHAPITFEHQTLGSDGELYWHQWSSRPILDAEDRLIEFQAIGRDITERKQTEQERMLLNRRLQEAQKVEHLAVLAGGIAHDFNNLLAVILGNAGLALFDIPEESSARVSVEQIESATRQAAELTKQMLAYAGRGHFMRQRLDLNFIVEETVRLLNASMSSGITLKYCLAPDIPEVAIDIIQFRQVMKNLIVNASEALADRGGNITVTTSLLYADCAYLTETYLAPHLPAGAYVALAVADTGPGMDAATQARIFEPFFSTKFPGRGLGLPTVIGIVRNHGGALKVESELGAGTTLTILLPVETPILQPQEGGCSGEIAALAARSVSSDSSVFTADPCLEIAAPSRFTRR